MAEIFSIVKEILRVMIVVELRAANQVRHELICTLTPLGLIHSHASIYLSAPAPRTAVGHTRHHRVIVSSNVLSVASAVVDISSHKSTDADPGIHGTCTVPNQSQRAIDLQLGDQRRLIALVSAYKTRQAVKRGNEKRLPGVIMLRSARVRLNIGL